MKKIKVLFNFLWTSFASRNLVSTHFQFNIFQKQIGWNKNKHLTCELSVYFESVPHVNSNLKALLWKIANCIAIFSKFGCNFG
jgi:hypothetical protein